MVVIVVFDVVCVSGSGSCGSGPGFAARARTNAACSHDGLFAVVVFVFVVVLIAVAVAIVVDEELLLLQLLLLQPIANDGDIAGAYDGEDGGRRLRLAPIKNIQQKHFIIQTTLFLLSQASKLQDSRLHRVVRQILRTRI